MSDKNVYSKFNEMLKDNILTCTETDLNEFLFCGILLKSKNKYVTIENKEIHINLVKVNNLDINLSYLLTKSKELSKKTKFKKIYFMTMDTYKHYKDKGYIVTQNGNEYYTFFNKDLWLVNILENF